MKQQEENCCGNCCWMIGEDTNGMGMCAKIFAEMVNCGDQCHGDQFFAKDKARHYVAVLIQANRYRRDTHVPAIYRMVNQKEFGRAIDFATEYIKTFMEL